MIDIVFTWQNPIEQTDAGKSESVLSLGSVMFSEQELLR